jgi:RimJ/RimL family protein N-acetyltransferase
MIAILPDEGEDFIVELDGVAIGKAGFHLFPVIGFIFAPDQWGRGLAAEALRAVLARAFAVHALPAVDADVDPRNAACLRLLERLGFEEIGRRERSWLVGDAWCDSVDLRLAAKDWPRKAD